MSGSVVSAVDIAAPSFSIDFAPVLAAAVNLRVTVQAYTAGALAGPVQGATFQFYSNDPQVNVSNTEPLANPQTAFTPAQFSSPVTSGIFYSGALGTEWSAVETFNFLIEVETSVPPDCDEISLVTDVKVSAYRRDRVHVARLVRGDRRCLIADFNGAIGAGRTITSITWRQQHSGVVMSNARIQGRQAIVDIVAQWGYRADLKCSATLDNGEVYSQLIVVMVNPSPWFSDEAQQVTGPRTLTVTP
jgi:hypothetical protein